MATVKFPSEMPSATGIDGNDKLMISKQATGEAYQATFNQAKEYLNITGIELEPLEGGTTSGTALVVPNGPTGENRTAEVASGKWYDFGSGPVEATADRRWKSYWNGTTWSLKDMGELPIQQGTETIVAEEIPKGKAVTKYVAPIYDSVDIVNIGKNYLNPSEIKPNLNYVANNNAIEDNTAYPNKGWLVPNIKLNQQYIYSGFPSGQAGTSVYVDENLNVIGSTLWTAPTTTTRLFTTPNNPVIKGVFFNIPKDGSLDNVLQLEEGSTATAYEPFEQGINIPASIVNFAGSDIESQINQNSESVAEIENGLNQIASISGKRMTEVYSPRSTNGYIRRDTGVFFASANWRATEPIPVLAGDNGVYTGFANSNVCGVAWYDSNMENFTPLIAPTTTTLPFIVPADGFIVGSYKAQEGDVQSLQLEMPAYFINEEAIKVDSVGFMPKKLWGQVGQEFRMYPAGITAMMADDSHLDFIWSLPNGSRDFVTVNPASINDILVSASVRNSLGVVELIGSTTLKMTKAVATNPSSKRYVLCIGDSLTQAGIWVAEMILRLTGINTFISPNAPFGNAVNNITPYTFSNVEFIGKRTTPNTTAPREGNGGWAYKNWLNDQTFGGNTNRFWNPSTAKFDLDYYLAQEGYSDINSTGSNLTIYTMCLWNSVYLESIEGAIANMDAVFQIIHSQRPEVKIKVMGLNTPPAKFIKPERGGQSPNTVMRDIIRYNKALEEYAEQNSSWVEFICISPQFHPEDSYPNINKPIHLRASDVEEVYATDHVHPNNRGYAQISDAAYYNFLYNYCN